MHEIYYNSLQMTNEELKQFKESLSITAVAKALGIDVVHGRCRCFFPQRHAHGDRTPSVSFSEERGTFRCWVCDDVRGDVISLVQLCKNMSFLDTAETECFILSSNMKANQGNLLWKKLATLRKNASAIKESGKMASSMKITMIDFSTQPVRVIP